MSSNRLRSALRSAPWELALPFLFLVLWAWTWPLWWNPCVQRVDLSPTATCSVTDWSR